MFRKLILIFIFSIVSCGKNHQTKVLDQKTYKMVLKEIILSNIISKQIKQKDSQQIDLLPLIYKKYHIDSLQLKKTTEYYSNKPEILEQIYAEIEKEFNQINDSLEKIKPSKKKFKTDSIKIAKEKIDMKKIKNKQKIKK
jgi:protein-tyrosine-phosphatase